MMDLAKNLLHQMKNELEQSSHYAEKAIYCSSKGNSKEAELLYSLSVECLETSKVMYEIIKHKITKIEALINKDEEKLTEKEIHNINEYSKEHYAKVLSIYELACEEYSCLFNKATIMIQLYKETKK